MKVKILAHTPEPEKLIAAAAKLCYSSSPADEIMENLTDEKVEKFLTKLVDMGHCYDAKTEVLTENGFKFWEDVCYKDKLAAVNPTTRELKGFEEPKELIKQQYKGKMVRFKSKGIDLRVTENHKVYCSLSKTQHLRTNPKYELIEANAVLNTGKLLYNSPIRMINNAKNRDYRIGNLDQYYALFGFFIGDGYTHKGMNQIKFHLKKDRKIKYLQALCNSLNLELLVKKNDNYVIDVENSKYPNKYFLNNFYNGKDKTFPIEFLKMTKNQYEYFIEGLLNSDGNYAGKEKNNVYYTTSDELADKLQSLMVINGNGCTIKKASNECNKVYIWKERSCSVMLNDSRSKIKSIVEDVDECIYCATVSTGLLVVRRNGKVTLSGNSSPIEHVSFTFMIDGVSRALLAQITRHRLASFSVRSQRYVNENSFDYVIPPEITKDNHLRRKFVDKVEIMNNLYNYLVMELMEQGRTREQAQEDARFVLPNACTTSMVMTMNARELMHFFNKRCCDRAQWEIRAVADEMLRQCKEVAPILFKNAGAPCVKGHCPEGSMSCGRLKK